MACLDDSDIPDYAELHCISSYSFLKGASHPDELVSTAIAQGYKALAITDECSLSGVVRAHVALLAKKTTLKLIIGSEICLEDGLTLIVLVRNREGYAQLCKLITVARRAAVKGKYILTRKNIEEAVLMDCLVLWVPPRVRITYFNEELSKDIKYSTNVYDSVEVNLERGSIKQVVEELSWVQNRFKNLVWMAVELHLEQFMIERSDLLCKLAKEKSIKLCAAGGVNMHQSFRRVIHDVQTAIRHNTTLTKLNYTNHANGQRYLRTRQQLKGLYTEDLLSETVRISELCNFSLDELRYEYPDELVPKNWTAIAWLQHLTEQGMERRWPEVVPEKVKVLVKRELKLIQEMKFEPYFLTVFDIVNYARKQNILCQGRGSAANSAVCYCLGITEVDPSRMNLLFERFVSKERNEPPDIDVDFEHERREEVIQYIYRKYGRHRAALAATVICYQPRSAIRDVAKVLGFSLDQINRLASSWQWWDGKELLFDETQTGIDSNSQNMHYLKKLVSMLIGFPRHLSQHVGGFVIAADDLSRLVPVENAAMQDRTVIQWEKDDLESLGLLKIDVLALGMLTAIRKMLASISNLNAEEFRMSDIPAEDPKVYRMIQQADTLGVFQIESRAQMSMLPRLRPENYYDLVVQVAIVRPGPIQGDMVHPYLSRRQGIEPVIYPSNEVKAVLGRTLGIPIFQEQVMQLAMVAAGFTAGEADQLRRSMAAWKKRGGLEKFEVKLRSGMLARGYTEQFSKQIFRQIQGFGDYGFPESHAASFALLAYVSSWLKYYYPAVFCAGLLNSQPMGFYAPAQLLQDAQRHGVKVKPVDINMSHVDCSLDSQQDFQMNPNNGRPRNSEHNHNDSKRYQYENNGSTDVMCRHHRKKETVALRLGFRLIKGLSIAGMQSIIERRPDAGYESVQQLVNLTGINKKDLQSLAASDALKPLAGHRHNAYWQAAGTEEVFPLYVNLKTASTKCKTTVEPLVMLSVPSEGKQIIKDYATLGLSLRRHPLELLREKLVAKGVCVASELYELEHEQNAVTAGLVINRQRPSTSQGVIFMTLEDETGYSNIIVWPSFAEAQRKVLLNSRLLAVHGTIQNKQGVVYVVAGRLEDLSPWLGALETSSRDFH